MTDKLGIAYVTPNLGWAGTSIDARTYSKFLNREYFCPYLIGFYSDGPVGTLARGDGTEVKVCDGDFEAFYEFISQNDVDVVHLIGGSSDVPKLIRQARKAGASLLVRTNVFGYPDETIRSHLIDLDLVNTRAAAQRFVRDARIGWDKFGTRCAVQYLSVGTEFFSSRPTADEVNRFRQGIGVQPDELLVGRVGRPDMAKWSEFPVEVMRRVVYRRPKTKFLVVGGLPDQILNSIRRHGMEDVFVDIGPARQEDLPLMYASLDILTHFSRIGESFGKTIAEAMAVGRPVVVNSTPWQDNSQIELVDNNSTGFVANALSTYASAVLLLLGNEKLRLEMGKKAVNKARVQFDALNLNRILEKHYVAMLSKKVPIERRVTEEYEGVEVHPNISEIASYATEHVTRLRNTFGDTSSVSKAVIALKVRLKPTSIEHYVGSLLLRRRVGWVD